MKQFLLFTFVACASAQDYTLSVPVNPINVYAGYPLTIEIDVVFTTPPYSHIYPVLTTSGLGITAVPWCGPYNPGCWGTPPFVYNSDARPQFWVVVTPSASVAPGPYTVTLTTTSNRIAHRIVVPIKVQAVPGLANFEKYMRNITLPIKVQSSPKLPGLANFEKYMRNTTSPAESYARCDPANPAKFGWAMGIESQVWYYDGALVYYEIADYTKDPKWKACAVSIASAYKTYALGGGTPGYRVFTQGLRRAFAETGDTTYRDAVQSLITNSAYAGAGGNPSDSLIRETAYMLRAYTDANLMGLKTDPAAVSRSLNWLLGMGETLFAGAPMTTKAREHQSFYDGLMAESLTYYFDNWENDPRIPPAIKKLCDWTWTYEWDDALGKIMYSPFPKNASYPLHCEDGCQQYSTQLINFVTPAYWWYARSSGDDTYRVKGDRMFAHSVDAEPWSGKEFSQVYKWSIPGLAWRKK